MQDVNNNDNNNMLFGGVTASKCVHTAVFISVVLLLFCLLLQQGSGVVAFSFTHFVVFKVSMLLIKLTSTPCENKFGSLIQEIVEL